MDGVMELTVIELDEVVYDSRARDGTWCTLPYPGHKKGCPNFPKCPSGRMDFGILSPDYKWYAVIEEFDLVTHAMRMYNNSVKRREEAIYKYLADGMTQEEAEKKAPKEWSDRQCRCVLYWQNGVRRRLLTKAEKLLEELGGPEGGVILTIPEANGVNVFATMARHGLFLKANPDYVYKVMLVGKAKDLYTG